MYGSRGRRERVQAWACACMVLLSTWQAAAATSIQVNLLLTGGSATQWTAPLQTALIAFATNGLSLPESNVSAQPVSTGAASGARKLLAAPAGVTCQLSLTTSDEAREFVLGGMGSLASDPAPAEDALAQHGFPGVAAQVLSLQASFVGKAESAAEAASPPGSGSSRSGLVVALAVVVPVLTALAAALAAALWLTRRRQRSLAPYSRMHKPALLGAHSSGGSPPGPDRRNVEETGEQEVLPQSAGAHSDAAAAAASEPPAAVSAQAEEAVPPLHAPPAHRAIPAGLPDEVQQMYMDFLNVWNTSEGPWHTPSARRGSSTQMPRERSATSLDGRSHSVLLHAQSSSDSEATLPQSLRSPSSALGTSMLPADWELNASDLSFSFQSNGQLVILHSDQWYTCYRAQLHGTKEVMVQIPHNVSVHQHREQIVDVAIVLKELNSTNVTAHFHGIVMDERPMLVMDWHQDNLRSLHSEPDRVNWYNGGQQLAVELARALVLLHQQHQLVGSYKTSHIMLCKARMPRLSLVGIRRLLLTTRLAKRRDLMPLDWAAPEIILGLKIDLAVDIFAFGILLWEMVTGDLPIKGAMRDVAVPGECPASIKNLIIDCMRGRAEDRPTTSEVLARLQSEAAGPATSAPALPQRGSGNNLFLLSRNSMHSGDSQRLLGPLPDFPLQVRPGPGGQREVQSAPEAATFLAMLRATGRLLPKLEATAVPDSRLPIAEQLRSRSMPGSIGDAMSPAQVKQKVMEGVPLARAARSLALSQEAAEQRDKPPEEQAPAGAEASLQWRAMGNFGSDTLDSARSWTALGVQQPRERGSLAGGRAQAGGRGQAPAQLPRSVGPGHRALLDSALSVFSRFSTTQGSHSSIAGSALDSWALSRPPGLPEDLQERAQRGHQPPSPTQPT